MFASSAVGTVLSQLPTYAITQLGFGSFDVLIVMAVILIAAAPAAVIYGVFMAKNISPKINQIVVYVTQTGR